MPSLIDAQSNFIDTINNGPKKLDPKLFSGPLDRVLLGLKAHANTISYARIVALEETFPLTRQHLGEAAFNALARDFVETGLARASDANRIGLHFPEHLGDATTTELAQIEWVWLESYHAAEAAPLTLADLGGMDEAKLLALRVASHPSVRLVPISVPIAPALQELAGTQPAAILTIRPDVEVRLLPLDAIHLAIINAAAQKNAVLGNLLAVAIEIAGETESLGLVMNLIGAGALVKAGVRHERDYSTL
jgi:hypothetical protein